MSKFLFSLFSYGILLLSTINSAFADDVNFSGRVVTESCEIDTANSQLNVVLGEVISGDITLGKKTAQVPFHITLMNCFPKEQNISVVFFGSGSSPIDQTNTSLLAPVAGESGVAATGVGIAIYDAPGGVVDSVPMVISKGERSTPQTTDESGSATFDFVADIENDGSSTVTDGDANATANITINYE